MQHTRDNGTGQAGRVITVLMFIVALAACGTTSDLQRADSATQQIDLSGYESAVVANFTDAATENKVFKSDEKGQAKKADYRAEVNAAGATFAEFIKAELDKLGVFAEVERGSEAGEGALLIDGRITRFERGNAAAKFLIGLGAGSTYFDATVRVSDGATGAELGSIVVDKNSWVLGGVISASQNVEGFMQGGAKKTARELYIAKFGKEPEK